MVSESYNPQEIEKKWRQYWKDNEVHKTNENRDKPKYYCLDMFPYPSGSGLHVGHWRGYVISDLWSRFKKLQGFNVLHPMGWDAFGLPAENDALKKGIHPRESTKKNIANFRRQFEEMGTMYDWNREINTSEPKYYKWTQWIFIKMYKEGLAYRKKMPINWCPDCKTGLANEEVVDGGCERCGTQITKKPLEQWMLKITDYADRLLEDLEKLEWPERVKKMQKNWIGRSKGAKIKFPVFESKQTIEVFTTRPDTLFGVTYMVLAPEHPQVDKLTVPERKKQVEQYLEKAFAKTNIERKAGDSKTGVFTGSYCENPVNGEKIPVWISDYVLMEYGTGAIMAVPAHDQRDFAFAKEFNLPVKRVVAKNTNDADNPVKEAYTEHGVLVNSGTYTGLYSEIAKGEITNELVESGMAEKKVNYKLRDWIFSRQRYWGEPIPIIYCEKCGELPVSEENLPVTLPDVEEYEPAGTGESPLSLIDEWVETKCHQCGSRARRETNTMPQWAGSSWYFLRYADSDNQEQPWSQDKVNYWLPVDFYLGGSEHAILHLLYARFFNKFLYDIGMVDFDEPFKRLFNHGMVCKDGEKMSKSKPNCVSPDEIVNKYGTDCLRIYELFIGPPDQESEWDDSGIEGVARFLHKMWNICVKSCRQKVENSRQLTEQTHKLIKKVTKRIKDFKMNTAISAFMSYSNFVAREAADGIDQENLEKIIVLLAPFAPHFAEEIWFRLGYEESIFELAEWPDYDPDLIAKKLIEIPVQVNGRVRETIKIEKGMEKGKVLNKAEQQEKIKAYLEGKEFVKKIYVPDRIVNFVLK